jgi:stage II sporulation protein D
VTEPVIAVGVLTSPLVRFTLDGAFTAGTKQEVISGPCSAHAAGGTVILEGNSGRIAADDGVMVEPRGSGPHAIRLEDVTIGVQFHWQRKEQQSFAGSLRFVITGTGLVAVNVVPVEEYLTSVIASEMSAASSLPFLKAHAITSRSWLLAQLEKSRSLKASGASPGSRVVEEGEKHIRWYDREDHELFDVCADDHCQRYQGITRAYTPAVAEAVRSTRGVVLINDGHVCDARFSKACGGVTEAFENVWEPVPHPYLAAVRDHAGDPLSSVPPLSQNAAADQWIRTSPPAFCNTNDPRVLSQVLVHFDQETRDFYRWRTEYTQDELAQLILQKSGIDFGRIIDLLPVVRGASGRITELNIKGSKRTMVIGKELEIRKMLSPSHLYSSAFVVDGLNRQNGVPERFVLTGAGWGHGVGLCQIGAAVMGEMGYSHEQILKHYFSGVEIKALY